MGSFSQAISTSSQFDHRQPPSCGRRLRWAAGSGLVLFFAVVFAHPGTRASAETFVWIDDAGITHLTDDASAVPESRLKPASDEIDSLRGLWKDNILGPETLTPRGSSGRESDRHARLLRGATEDLRRGETARATATLRSLQRLAPQRPETYWYLASLDRRRGRYTSAHAHLVRFLELAGDDLAVWRKRAQKRLDELADEQQLVDPNIARDPLAFLRIQTPNFRLELDSELGTLDRDYAETVLRYLEEARREVSAQIGVTPLEPLGVVLYGKAAYLQAHRHRFSFQTVGFFDGRIHVTSPAHPAEALRSLLYHEYTHAVYREQTGGDRPYWLNEGLAERMERRSRNFAASTRSERISLRTRIQAGNWIPLRAIAPSFSGLSDEDARAAYLESVIATAYIEEHTTKQQRARMLSRLGDGFSVDQALHEAMGLDTDSLDAKIRQQILDEFPAIEP